MISESEKEAALASLDQSVQQGLRYYRGEGRTSTARVGHWGAREMLIHLCSRHFGTAWGIMSAGANGPPWPMPASNNDQINAITVRMYEGVGYDELLRELERAHERMLSAAREAPDWDAPACLWFDGRLISIRQRIETLDHHMLNHLRELREAAT